MAETRKQLTQYPQEPPRQTHQAANETTDSFMNPLTQGAPAEVSDPGDTKSPGQGQTQRARAPSAGGQAAIRKSWGSLELGQKGHVEGTQDPECQGWVLSLVSRVGGRGVGVGATARQKETPGSAPWRAVHASLSGRLHCLFSYGHTIWGGWRWE